MQQKRAFLTGPSGQDGSFLCELLLSKGYDVHCLIRQSTQFTPDRWGNLTNAMRTGKVTVHHGDINDALCMRNIIEQIQPDECYSLAAQSHVGQSFEQPLNTVGVTAIGPLHLLDAIKRSSPQTRFYHASSSEQFGKVVESPQKETTRFHPRSPYGCAKVFAHYITQNYREAYGIHASNGILFNHESERRGATFVTRKISLAVARIAHGLQDELVLGNTDVKRDWGYAPDYVEAMWLMLQQDEPGDFVIGTGITHTVQDFIDTAFDCVGLDPKEFVRQDPRFVRPAEVDTLRADPTKAREQLGWQPKIKFKQLVTLMVTHDLKLAEQESRALRSGA